MQRSSSRDDDDDDFNNKIIIIINIIIRGGGWMMLSVRSIIECSTPPLLARLLKATMIMKPGRLQATNTTITITDSTSPGLL